MTGNINGRKIPDTTYEQIVRTVVVTGTAVYARPNSRYITTNSAPTTIHLPDHPQDGQIVSVVCEKGGGWQISLEPGKSILNGRYPGRSADLVYLASDDRWVVVALDAFATRRDIYGVRIDTTNQNPETAVEYTDDAVGFVPMRGNNGAFDWGSWQLPFGQLGIRPCLFENGAVNYYLDPDDFTKKVDGTAADITSGNDGDVMIEFPKIYWSFSKVGTDRYVRMSQYPHEGYVCLAHTRGDTERDYIHIGAYKGSVLSGALRSLSGAVPAYNQTHAKFREYAHANGSGYEQYLFYQMVLLQVLYVIFFKSLNGQTALGRGNVDASVRKNTGARNTDGMFWGSTNGTQQIKFCGIEDWWGNQYDWVDGFWSTSSTDPARKLWIATDDFDTVPYRLVEEVWVDADPRPDNYREYGTGFATNQDGYIKDVHGTNETGFVTALPGGGSETTYYCDYAFLRAGCLGYFGGSWATAGDSGPFRLGVNTSPTGVFSTIGGRLTHVEKDE